VPESLKPRRIAIGSSAPRVLEAEQSTAA